MKLIIKKNNLICFLIALIISFSEVLKDGNYNLLYIFGIIFFFKMILSKNIREFGITCVFTIFLTISALIISTFSPLFSSYSKTIFYCLKLILCFLTLLYFKNARFKYDDIKLITKYFINLQCIFTVIAILLYGNELLWINNDVVNGFVKIRLKLFFIEPSYMAFYMSIAIFIEIYDFCFEKSSKNSIMRIIFSFIIIILGFSMSGIIYSMFSIIIVLMFSFIQNAKKNKLSKTSLLTLIFFIVILGAMCCNENVSGRIERIINGTDSSTSYRVKKTMQSLPIILEKSYYLGFGYGNMNTVYGISFLNNLGVAQNYSNAFPYFIAETGVCGIFFLIFAHKYILKEIRKNYTYISLRKMMICFLIFTSIAGNWFTNPGLWLMYGLIVMKGRNNIESGSNKCSYLS